MTQSYLEKNAEQLQQFLEEPQKFFQQAHEAQLEFLNQLNIFWQEFPQAYQKYVAEQQDKLQHLQGDISETWKEQPNDWATIGSIISDFNTEQFSSHLENVQKHQERLEKLFSSYTKLDVPFFFKDIFQQTQDEFKKATNEMLSSGTQKAHEINKKTKENLQSTQRAINKAQQTGKEVARKAQHHVVKTSDEFQKNIKKVVDLTDNKKTTEKNHQTKQDNTASEQAQKRSYTSKTVKANKGVKTNVKSTTKAVKKPAVKVGSKTAIRTQQTQEHNNEKDISA